MIAASTIENVKLFLDLSTHPADVVSGVKDGLERPGWGRTKLTN